MEKKLRIAIICDAIDDDTLGGSFISGKRFGAWLAKAGHHIVWITSKFADASKKKDFSYAKVYEFPHTPRIWAYGVRFAYTSVTRLCKVFEEEHIDIIYSIQPNIMAWQAVRAARRLHIPIVSHSHTLPELFVPWAPHGIQNLIKKIVVSMYRKYDGIISPTEFLKKRYDDGLVGIRQAVIGNGVDTHIFHPAPAVESKNFTILYVGRLDPAKNITLLLDALHLLKQQKKLDNHIRCTIVGWWCWESKLKTITDEYWLWDVVTFMGRLDAASQPLVQAFQKASVFVLPSCYETEWMVVLEAMACGCPLLIADSPNSAAKDFVHDNWYTFDCKHPQDLANKIYKMNREPELCQRMRTASSEAAQKYSFTLSIQKLESFLSSFCKK